MGLKPGQTNNPKGRPKGASNKITMSTRAYINAIIEKNLPKVQRDLNKLKPLERLQMLEKLLAYSIPKMSSMSLDGLSNEQIEAILKILKNEHNEQ